MKKTFSFQNIIYFFAFIITVARFFYPITHDVELHYFHSIRLIEEGGLYTRWIEVMPPTIYLIYALPAYITKLTGVSYSFSMNIFCLALSFFSIYLVSNVLKKQKLEEWQNKGLFLATIFLYFVIPASISASNDRDLLLYILALPWIFECIFKQKHKSINIILASIGFMIKPYNLAIPLLLILFSNGFNRTTISKIFSKENLFLAFLIIIQTALNIYFFPEYYTELVPVLAISYTAINANKMSQLYYTIFTLGFVYFSYHENEKMNFLDKKIYILFLFGCLIPFFLNGFVAYNTIFVQAPIF